MAKSEIEAGTEVLWNGIRRNPNTNKTITERNAVLSCGKGFLGLGLYLLFLVAGRKSGKEGAFESVNEEWPCGRIYLAV
jgi:hypothetical protein